MRLLFVIDSLGTGGAERSTADLFYFLRDHGVELKIVALKHRHEGIEKEVLAQGFDVYFLASKSLPGHVREISRLIKVYKPDIVHSVLFKSNIRVRMSRLWNKFRHVESLVNCSYDPIRLKDPKVNVLAFHAYKIIDTVTSPLVEHFLAITEAVKNHYIQALKLSSDRISVIYRARPDNEFLKTRAELHEKYIRELSLDHKTLLITHVGRQEFQKGHLSLLKAIGLIEKTITIPVAFLLVGREGNNTVEIKKFLSETALQSNIFFLGHRYDVPQILAASDIFVFPSLYEGLGGVLIEAQAAGLPIICSDLPVFNEVVLTGHNALTFQSRNEKELARCLLHLIEDSDLRLTMGKRSLTNFQERFGLKKVNQEMLSFYKSMIA